MQIGRNGYPATAEILTEGPDFDRCWKIVNDLNRYKDGGRYDHYQTLTTRKIPVVVLVVRHSTIAPDPGRVRSPGVRLGGPAGAGEDLVELLQRVVVEHDLERASTRRRAARACAAR